MRTPQNGPAQSIKLQRYLKGHSLQTATPIVSRLESEVPLHQQSIISQTISWKVLWSGTSHTEHESMASE